jgi:hypothetical protein
VTTPVVPLVPQFQEALRGLVDGIRSIVSQIEVEANLVKNEATAIKNEAVGIKNEFAAVHNEFAGISNEASLVSLDFSLLEPDVGKFLEPFRDGVRSEGVKAGSEIAEAVAGGLEKGQPKAASAASSVGLTMVDGVLRSPAGRAAAQLTDSMVGEIGKARPKIGLAGGVLGRTFGDGVRRFVPQTSAAARSLTEAATGGFGKLQTSTLSAGTGLTSFADKARSAATAVVRLTVVQRVIAVATRAWAAVQGVLNVIMSLNPIGLVIAAIVVLVAAIVLAYQRSSTFRAIVQQAFQAIRNAVLPVVNAIQRAIAVAWPYIEMVIRVAVTGIRAYVTTYFNAVRFVVTNVINGLRTVIRAGIAYVVNVIRGVSAVVGIVRNAFNGAHSAVTGALNKIVSAVRGLPGRATGALGNMARVLFGPGIALIDGFVNGIRAAAGKVVSVLRNSVIDKIPGPIRNALGISSPSRVMTGIGMNIGEGLAVGIRTSGDMVADAMTRLVPVPKAGAVRPAFANLATAAIGATGSRVAPAPAPVTVNVHPRAGQSEYEIGRVAAREVAWAAKNS